MIEAFEENPLFNQRQKKADRIRQLGLDPFPRKYDYTHSIASVVFEYSAKSAPELDNEKIALRTCGRLVAMRGFGKAAFASIMEGGAQVQIYVKKDQVDAKTFELFELADIGDFVGVGGYLFRTRTGELTLMVQNLEILAKGMLPLPEKWHGLTDVELRYRQRYLDLIANPEVRKTFIIRSRIVKEIRAYLDSLGFIEVETPMMQPIAGGATARPFKTFHNALGMDFYLRIAPELYLKRLIVGGMERVYEINRNFRNEGVSTQHNPEFTMLEFYQAYSDFRDLMTLTEEMLTQVVEKIHGDREIEYAGKKVSFDRWQRLTIKQAIIKYWGLPNESFGMKMATPPPSEEELSSPQLFDQLLNQPSLVLPIRSDIPVSAGPLVLPSELTHGEKLIHLFEHVAEEHLIDPTFIYEFPVEISPLSKTKPDDPATVERFELFVGGLEIANAYSELNDPLEQYMRFEEQVRNRQKGNEEAHAMDEDYIRALGYGMPPTAGEGIGIDRFVMLLTDSRSIRDVILFPHLRPEHGRPTEEQQPSADS